MNNFPLRKLKMKAILRKEKWYKQDQGMNMDKKRKKKKDINKDSITNLCLQLTKVILSSITKYNEIWGTFFCLKCMITK